MSHLVRLEGKHTAQTAHCALYLIEKLTKSHRKYCLDIFRLKSVFDKSGSEARSLPATVISEATPLNLRATKGSPGDEMAARDWSSISLETNQMAAASFERTPLLELVGQTLFQGQSEQN